MSAKSLLLVCLLQLAQASGESGSGDGGSGDGGSGDGGGGGGGAVVKTPGEGGSSAAVVIIVVIIGLLALGGGVYWFVFRDGAMYAHLWTNRIGGSSSSATAAATGANPNNNLPMVALRVSGDEYI